MYAEITSAIASLKTVYDLAKGANSMSNHVEILDAVNNVQQKLAQALAATLASVEKQASLAERVRELEAQLAEQEQWAARSKDYRLQAVGALKNHFVQVYQPAGDAPQARHWACARCFEGKKVSVLSADQRHRYLCPVCSTTIDPIIPGGTLAPIESAYPG